MTQEDISFLDNCCFFWKEKGNMERYTGFDAQRLLSLDPQLYLMWQQYKTSVANLNKYISSVELEYGQSLS